MSARRGVHAQTSVFVKGDVGSRPQPLADRDVVVLHLSGDEVAVHLDRAGIAALTVALGRAVTALDAAQDEMAAAIEAEQAVPDTERVSA